jgi:hypothetical protein
MQYLKKMVVLRHKVAVGIILVSTVIAVAKTAIVVLHIFLPVKANIVYGADIDRVGKIPIRAVYASELFFYLIETKSDFKVVICLIETKSD